VNLGNLELINKDGGKKFSVKCPAEFSGTGANGKKLNYSAHITFDIQDGKLMVASLDSFKAQ